MKTIHKEQKREDSAPVKKRKEQPLPAISTEIGIKDAVSKKYHHGAPTTATTKGSSKKSGRKYLSTSKNEHPGNSLIIPKLVTRKSNLVRSSSVKDENTKKSPQMPIIRNPKSKKPYSAADKDKRTKAIKPIVRSDIKSFIKCTDSVKCARQSAQPSKDGLIQKLEMKIRDERRYFAELITQKDIKISELERLVRELQANQHRNE